MTTNEGPESFEYTTRPISMHGQCLFVVRGKNDPSPRVSVQMPIDVAEYIVRLSSLASEVRELVRVCKMGAQVDLPTLMEWIADRLVHVYGESSNVDYVMTMRERANALRLALSAPGIKSLLSRSSAPE